MSNSRYLEIPLCSEFSPQEYYTYETISNMFVKCDKNRQRIFKCRTIGILESRFGTFYMQDIDLNCPRDKNKAVSIQVSLIYLKQPLMLTGKPQTVQLFGTLQWEKAPVIYANIVQVLTPPLALKLSEAMLSVVKHHFRKPQN